MPTFLSAGVYHGAMCQTTIQLPAQYLDALLAASEYGRAGGAHVVGAYALFLADDNISWTADGRE